MALGAGAASAQEGQFLDRRNRPSEGETTRWRGVEMSIGVPVPTLHRYRTARSFRALLPDGMPVGEELTGGGVELAARSFNEAPWRKSDQFLVAGLQLAHFDAGHVSWDVETTGSGSPQRHEVDLDAGSMTLLLPRVGYQVQDPKGIVLAAADFGVGPLFVDRVRVRYDDGAGGTLRGDFESGVVPLFCVGGTVGVNFLATGRRGIAVDAFQRHGGWFGIRAGADYWWGPTLGLEFEEGNLLPAGAQSSRAGSLRLQFVSYRFAFAICF